MFERDLYRTLARNLPGFGILLFDHSLRYMMALGDDVLSSSGTSEHELVGKALDEVGFPSLCEQLERNYRAALDGHVRDLEVKRSGRAYAIRTAPIRSATGAIVAGIVTYHDVTEMVRNREALHAVALADELTGVYNRRGFMLLARQQMRVARRTGAGALLFFIDLNDLKVINDTKGHESGDDALRAAARILTVTFRESDIIARYGGDEFVAFVSDVKPEMEEIFRSRLATKVNEANAREVRYKLSLSVGCAVCVPGLGDDLEAMIYAADRDMYSKKRLRKSGGGSDSVQAMKAKKLEET